MAYLNGTHHLFCFFPGTKVPGYHKWCLKAFPNWWGDATSLRLWGGGRLAYPLRFASLISGFTASRELKVPLKNTLRAFKFSTLNYPFLIYFPLPQRGASLALGYGIKSLAAIIIFHYPLSISHFQLRQVSVGFTERALRLRSTHTPRLLSS